MIRQAARAADERGCKVGLYNHGGWFGEPENQAAIIEAMQKSGIKNVGIVYNFHHGHEHMPRFPALAKQMAPHLLTVNVNGMRAGSVWAPPYRIDITRLLRAGDNAIEVRVANTALNALAGRPAPDYRLLGARYGERFQAQDFSHIAPQPSGLVGAIKFIEASGEGSCAR